MILEKNKRIGIWGFGVMGKSAIDYLYSKNYQLSVMDKRSLTKQERTILQEKNITLYNEHDQKNFFSLNDFIIISPGINISEICYATHKNKLIHELDFFYQAFKKPIIAVTGSVGKTSIIHILSELFKQASIPIVVGGNIGIPTFDIIKEQNSVDYALLEVSSFQLMHCAQFRPAFSIWTNFYPNHLDYHPSEQDYLLAKQKIIEYQNNNTSSLVPCMLREKIYPPSPHHIRGYFTLICPTIEYLQNLQKNEHVYYITNNTIMRYTYGIHTSLLSLTPELLGLSFIDNILLIVAACDMMKINTQILQKITHTVLLPEHRIEKIYSFNNINFYNDSKATTTASTLAAVQKLKNSQLHLFLGGLSKGVDREPFIAQLKNNVKHIYCFGKESNLLHAMCSKFEISATPFTTLNEAFTSCSAMLQPGDCVLLSPSGSSYDLYENYEQRGKHFKELIAHYIQKHSS
ncbi:MAG TPA: UDP-N-acetylmuramoyl-L-alanine--D-glutamate ligase [Candidatus Babeliales bacterium]|nr:UDP-N-acetylmuramoyl-L-alanine--D-glutamate ligase [Candidatus Babeliales bacterium]